MLGVTRYEPKPLSAMAVISVTGSVAEETVCDSPALTPTLLPETMFTEPGFTVRFVDGMVRTGSQQVKSETVMVTLHPAPVPRLSVTVIGPRLPVELWDTPSKVTAEMEATEELVTVRLPGLITAFKVVLAALDTEVIIKK